MDIQNNIDCLYAEIEELQQEITEGNFMTPDQEEQLELLITKSIKFGELCAQRDAKSQAVPESTGITDVNGKLIFVGDTVEFIGGCTDFLDLSGYGSPKYIVNKGDKMIVRKLKSGYTLSLPWIDCDTPNRIGNLGNYDFWNIHRDFVVIEAQEQSHD